MEENKNVSEQIEVVNSNVADKKEKQEAILEVITAVFLGLVALAMAWATWIGSLHGGNQATNYTTSNNLSSEGNSMYNEGSQYLVQDMMTWNTINDLSIERAFAEANEDEESIAKIDWKMEKIMTDNCSEEFLTAINWALEQEDEAATPFVYEMEDGTTYADSYFTEAKDVIAESDAKLEEGKKDNANGDAFGLVTVIYSVVLFLLGIVGIFKRIPNRGIVLGIAIVGCIVASIYMFTIPMPTGFSIMSYFK